MKKKMKFIIPSIITLSILFIIYFFQGLYPFGGHSIVQVDADFQFIPVLYRIYDFLHGTGNIIYDDIGFGNNIYISMIIQGSIFSPLSLLLYFTSRSNIINFFNIIVMIKLSLISLTSYIYINKTFKVNEFYKIIFAILYTFSGWVILNYFNVMWLDSVILFPLIIMFLNELLNREKYLGYIITLSLSLMISYYISYFILLFILFYSFVYIFLKVDKGKLKKVIFKLGISTFIAILISSVSLLPALYQTFLSSRFDSVGSNILFYNFINKSIYLMFSSVFLVLFIKLLFKYKKDIKNIYIYLILLILFSVGIFIEPINLAIHMGSYWSFPYRYSFITLFVLMSGSLYYLEKYETKGINKLFILRIIMFILLGISLVYLNSIFYDSIKDSQLVLDFNDIDVYKKILIIFTIIVLMIILSFSFKNKIIRYISFSIVCLLQIFIYSSWTMFYEEGYFLTKNSNNINNNLKLEKYTMERYKMGYDVYTPDYGFIYQVNTLDNWIHILPQKQIDAYDKLGYYVSSTRVGSYGGTIFTDWLFNMGYMIDREYKDEDIYNLLDQYEDYYLYEYNYNNGFGLIYNKLDHDINVDVPTFELHNIVYRELLNKDNDIIKIDTYTYLSDSVVFNYDIDSKGFLYIDLLNEVDYIKVNDNYINFTDSYYIIDLGLYDKDVNIEIKSKDDIDRIDFTLGFIKYDDIINLSNNVNNVKKVKNGYNINVINDMDNGYLFLPINNIDELNIFVNDKRVDIDNYMDNFVSVKLDNGDNNIRVRYEMPLFKLGIVLSILGVICLILFNKIPVNKIILNITYYGYIIISLGCYFYYYCICFLKYYNV